MFDVNHIESEARVELEAQLNEKVLNRLHEAKGAALSRLEEAKQDLNLIDAEINARTPQPEVTEEAQG